MIKQGNITSNPNILKELVELHFKINLKKSLMLVAEQAVDETVEQLAAEVQTTTNSYIDNHGFKQVVEVYLEDRRASKT